MLEFLRNSISSTIKEEGFELSNSGISKWLSIHNMLPMNSKLLSFKDIKEWYRSGAETFMSIAEILFINNNQHFHHKFVLKALVGLTPHNQAKTWIERRQKLVSLSIPVSTWFDIYSCTIVEPYYPHGSEIFLEQKFLLDLVRIAFLLDINGFQPLSLINDIRSDGVNLFYVDFGFDLGDNDKDSIEHSIKIVRMFCEKKKICFPEKYYTKLRSTFNDSL